MIFFIAYIVSKLLKLPYGIATPAGMIEVYSFFEPVAISHSPVALATIVDLLVKCLSCCADTVSDCEQYKAVVSEGGAK